VIAHAGHNLPQEAPQAFAEAVMTVRGWISAPADRQPSLLIIPKPPCG